jgi:hypothetical protein
MIFSFSSNCERLAGAPVTFTTVPGTFSLALYSNTSSIAGEREEKRWELHKKSPTSHEIRGHEIRGGVKLRKSFTQLPTLFFTLSD